MTSKVNTFVYGTTDPIRAGRGLNLVRPATGAYRIEGPKLLGPDGLPFEIRGANASITVNTGGYVFDKALIQTMPEFYYDSEVPSWSWTIVHGLNGTGPNDTTTTVRIDQAKAMGWNTVRINHALLASDPTYMNPDKSKTALETGIRRLTAAGLVVIMEAHDLTGSDPTWAASEKYRTYWDDFIVRYADDPKVWANPFNETHKSATSMTPWIDFHTSLVKRMADQGYAGKPLIIDLPRWAQGIDKLADGSLDVALANMKAIYPDILLGWHAYGHADASTAANTLADHTAKAQAAVARGHAIHIGEFGVSHALDATGGEGHTITKLGADWVIDHMRTNVPEMNGALIWHSHHSQDGRFPLTLDRYPFWEQPTRQAAPLPAGLDTYGTKFYNWCHV